MLDQTEEVLGVAERDSLELALFYLFGEGEGVARLEGSPQCCDFVDEAASRPNIGFLVVLAIAYLLRRHIVRCSDVSLREL